MKKTKSLLIGFVITFITVLIGYNVSLSEPDKTTMLKLKLKKPQKTEERMIAFNNWNYAMRNDGSYMYRASSGNFGGEFPRGSGYSCVYAAGMYIGGLKAGSGGDPDTVNVSQVEFESELLPGKVLIGGAKDLKYRGYKDPNTGGDVTTTAPMVQLSGESYLSDEYKVYLIDQSLAGSDYTNWPVYAPRLLDGKPLLLSGAAAQTYAVFNDMTTKPVPDGNDPAIHNPRFGLEMELESFAFTAGLLSNGVFLKLSITNKSDRDYHGAYMGLWADPDVGLESGDDLARVDTNRGLGMVFSNPVGSDLAYTALGLDFLQGPVVDSSEVPTSLIRKFYDDPSGAYRKVLKYNRETALLEAVDLGGSEFRLGATAFISYPNPNGEPSRLHGDVTRYWYIQGLTGDAGLPKPGGPYDPTATGNNPGDQRIIHGVGPFVLKSGSTQEIWFGFAGARGNANGPGAGDHYNPTPGSAVAVLQAVDDAMQIAFDNALASPQPPTSPVVTAVALDGQVNLTWDNRSEYSYDRYGKLLGINTANFNGTWRDYDFEGYRVYKSLTGLGESWTQIAEFDLINGVTVINDTLADTRGTVLYDVHVGSDNGIQHTYVDNDVINQRLYYYSVTAYDYQPLFRQLSNGQVSGFPRSLESPLTGPNNLKLVVPMAAPAGYAYDGSISNLLPVRPGTNTYGHATMTSEIVNPLLMKENKTYFIEMFRFDSTIQSNRALKGVPFGKLAYRMIDSASGAYVPFDNFTDNPLTYWDTLPGNDVFTEGSGDSIFDDRYYSTEISNRTIGGNEHPLLSTAVLPRLNGAILKLVSDTIGVKDIYEVGAGDTLRSVFYTPSRTGKYTIKAVASGGTSFVDSILRYSTGLQQLNAFNNFINSDYEIRFLSGATDSSAVYLSTGAPTSGGFNKAANKVPFQIWKLGWNGVDTTDVRLSIKAQQLPPLGSLFRMDNNFTGFPGTLYKRYSERLTVLDSAYAEIPGPFGTLSSSVVSLANIVIENQDTIVRFPSSGTVIRIVSHRPILPGNVFVYRQFGNSPFSKKSAKTTLKDVKVVPNPYYGRQLEYQSSLFDKKVKFHHLPTTCTIRIFNVAGDLIRTIQHNDASHNNRIDSDPLNRTKDVSTIAAFSTSTEEWDLRNTKGAFVASGMYIALIEAPGLGKTTVKFAIIQEQMRIDGPDVR